MSWAPVGALQQQGVSSLVDIASAREGFWAASLDGVPAAALCEHAGGATGASDSCVRSCCLALGPLGADVVVVALDTALDVVCGPNMASLAMPMVGPRHSLPHPWDGYNLGWEPVQPFGGHAWSRGP